MDAKSWRVETTWTLPSEGAARATSRARASVSLFMSSSERMGAVGAYRELQLDESFGGIDAAGIAAVPRLAADLRELARPERHGQRFSLVAEVGLHTAI